MKSKTKSSSSKKALPSKKAIRKKSSGGKFPIVGIGASAGGIEAVL